MGFVTKKVTRCTLAIVLALGLCTGAAQAKDGDYAILMKTLANPFWGAMGEGVEEGAKAVGVSYFIQAVESDQAAESQLNVCNTMLQRSPTALITAAINSTNLLPCLSAAQQSGIPVVDLDGNLDPAVLNAEGIEIAFRIGSNNTAAGGQAADYMVSQLGADATGAVLIIEGLSGNITGQARVSGFTDRLAALAPGLEVVASLPGDWDRGRAASITNDIMLRAPNLVGIFAANDGMALGAVESVFAGGRGGEVIIIGVDGNSDAVSSIKSGRLSASVAQLPYLVGFQAVENVQKVLAGESVEKNIMVPTMVLTQAVLDTGTEPMLEYVR
jgi:ABC-type sugar transport system substrate-binding protein